MSVQDCILRDGPGCQIGQNMTNYGHILANLANSSLYTPHFSPDWPVVPSDRFSDLGPGTSLEQRGFWLYY